MAGDVEEPWLKFIDIEHKPLQAAFICPHCRDPVYTLNNSKEVTSQELFPGIKEVTWSGVVCDTCGAMFDLFRTTHHGPPFFYTGSLTMYAFPADNAE